MMKLNLVLFFGIACLADVIFLNFVDAFPLIKPILAKNQTEKPTFDHVQSTEEKPAMQMFGNRVKSASSQKIVKHEEFQATNASEILPIEKKEIQSALKIPPREKKSGKNVEITISLPPFKTDFLGNWVYNPWGLTLGKVWQDTRFGGKVTIPRIRLDSDPNSDYYPRGELSSVCVGKTTVYNVPRIMRWLNPHVYDFVHETRPVFHNLRRNLFSEGNPEECHTIYHIKFRQFQECNLQRNQRMEYLIPKYPSHQSKPRPRFIHET